MFSIVKFKTGFITWSTVLFICEIIVMQFVYSSFNLFTTPLSVYGTGKLGFVICSGLCLIGMNYILLFTGIVRSNGNTVFFKIGGWLLLVVGVCVFFIAGFQTDIGPTISLRGKIHVVAAHLHFILLPFAAMLIVIGSKGTLSGMYRRYTLTFAIVCLASISVLGFRDFFHARSVDGMIQKVLIMIILGWIIYSGKELGRAEQGPV